MAADAGKMQDLRSDFAMVAYGYAIDQICDITPNDQKVSFLADYIDARWWLWRARTGVDKTISKKMAEKAWSFTQGGRKCDDKSQAEIVAALAMLKDFPTRAEALFGTPSKSLLNPKPNQKRIFASYQSARLGWIIAKKCNPDIEVQQKLYQDLMDTRKLMLSVFRPNQMAGLEKATSEMHVWGTMGQCTAKRLEFAGMADGFLTELRAIAKTKFVQDPKTNETEQATSLTENNQNS